MNIQILNDEIIVISKPDNAFLSIKGFADGFEFVYGENNYIASNGAISMVKNANEPFITEVKCMTNGKVKFQFSDNEVIEDFPDFLTPANIPKGKNIYYTLIKKYLQENITVKEFTYG